MENLESRVTDLEIHISHQEKMLEELNSVIISQQQSIEKIKNFNNFLIQNLQNSGRNEAPQVSDVLEKIYRASNTT